MYYPMVWTDDVLNTNNNKIAFTELSIFVEEAFEIKFQEGIFHKSLNVWVCESHLGFSIGQNDHIVEVVN